MKNCSACGVPVYDPLGLASTPVCQQCWEMMDKLAERIAKGNFLTQDAARVRIENMVRNIREEHQEYHRNEQ